MRPLPESGHGQGQLRAHLGERFAAAVAAKDVSSLRDILDPDVTFRGLTPSRVWEVNGLEEAVEVLFENWFEKKDRIVELESVNAGGVQDRGRVDYRLRVHNPDGDYLVEQVAYYDAESSRITWMSILCSGYRAIVVGEEELRKG